MTAAPLRVAVVGYGDIAQRYGETMAPHESVRIAGATDLIAERAVALVKTNTMATKSMAVRLYNSEQERTAPRGAPHRASLTGTSRSRFGRPTAPTGHVRRAAAQLPSRYADLRT